jgi:glycosyltransferase involved in cell wall biosynthesis
MGLETYRYPATRRMLEALPHPPDLVHLHNLHGGYFDLRVLPGLSASLPVAMTLHDAWLLSGHCAHSMGCDRWRIGCGACPDLDIYPAVRRDATARNWTRKREIFAGSRLHVATPSRWLADKVRESILSPSLAELKVIPNGVDLESFRPGDRLAARADTFPSTVLEALACGTPVVATAIGGIPEQVAGREEPTGILVPPGGAAAMAAAVARLLPDEPLLQTLGGNARRDAERRFDAEAQCEAYLAWFREILEGRDPGR